MIYGNSFFLSRFRTITVLEKSGNKKVVEKIKSLLEEIQLTPFEGTGKPEALKHNLIGYWSRRITNEHRLVYKIENHTLYVAQLRYHY